MALIKEKGAKDDKAVPMDFGQAQDALATGKYEEVIPQGSEAGPEIHQGVMREDPPETEPKPAAKHAAKADAK